MNQRPIASEERGRLQTLHSDVVHNFLAAVATQTVTPQEEKQRAYQRLLLARQKSVKKLSTLKHQYVGKLKSCNVKQSWSEHMINSYHRLSKNLTFPADKQQSSSRYADMY